MRYFYYALGAVLAVLLVVLIVWLIIWLRRRYARRKVCSLTVEEKCCRLNAALEPFGFCYEERDDSISSGMYPWQRKMGYCLAYDEKAVAMNMVIDCEPIYFDYGGRRYLIEFWKGQYGCTTGAEIGVYINDSRDFQRDPAELFYDCANDEERLPMAFCLRREGEVILRRRDCHWWLTGFRVGMFSWPGELVLDVEICFPNCEMCSAFCQGLKRAGYGKREICVEGHRVSFTFCEPRGKNGRRPKGICCRWVQWRNKRNCRCYCRVTRPFCTTLDRISFLGYCFPLLYRLLIRIGIKCSPRRYRRCRRKCKI